MNSSFFNLLGLPGDLLELLSLFFSSEEAASILLVSTSFHDIFARSVWRVVYQPFFYSSLPVRTAAIARYGRLVRSFQGFNFVLSEPPFDFVTNFPNLSKLEFNVHHELSTEQYSSYLDAVASLHGLRQLEVAFWTTKPPFTPDSLADAVIKRSHSADVARLKKLQLVMCDYDDPEPYQVLVDAAKKLTAVVADGLDLTVNVMCFNEVKSPKLAQLAVLRPYLVQFDGDDYRDAMSNQCAAPFNRERLSPEYPNGQLTVFQMLKYIRINLCCANSNIFDYSTITPHKFPQMPAISLAQHEGCPNVNNLHLESGRAARKILVQRWPMLTLVDLRIPTDIETLDEIFALNPLLSTVDICLLSKVSSGEQWTFDLVWLPRRLPKLERLTLTMADQSHIVTANPASDARFFDRIAELRLKQCRLSSDALELILTAIPRLNLLRLDRVSFVALDGEESRRGHADLWQVAGRNQSVKRLYLDSMHLDGERWNHWQVLGLVELFSDLEKVYLCEGAKDLGWRIRERFPHLSVLS